MSKLVKILIAFIGAALICFSGTPASAATGTSSCTVTQIGLDGGNPRLKLFCSGDSNIYYTNPGGSCSASAIDTVKMWHSMAMSAFLGSKKLNISWDNGCGPRNISNIDLTN